MTGWGNDSLISRRGLKACRSGLIVFVLLSLVLSGCFGAGNSADKQASPSVSASGGRLPKGNHIVIQTMNSNGETKEVTIPEKEAALMDTIQFGNSESESVHHFTEVKSITGQDGPAGDSFRKISPGGSIEFEMKVNPDKTNYLTVQLWGSDTGKGGLFIVDSMFPNLDVFKPHISTDWPELNELEEEATFDGRYFYSTYPIPTHLTKNRTVAKIKLISTGELYFYVADPLEQKEPSRGIYKAYTHVDPFFAAAQEKQGKRPALSDRPVPGHNGMSQYDYLVEQANLALKQIVSWQLYGPEWDRLVAEGKAPKMATGAIWFGRSTPFKGTKEEWKKSSNAGTVGSNGESMNGVDILAKAYFSPWSNYYHKDEIIDRVANGLDYYTIEQGKDGGFLDSSQRWIGGPNRTASNAGFEGGGIFIGQAFLQMADLFKEKGLLDAKIDNDDNPNTPEITRREAYAEMFERIQNGNSNRYRPGVSNQEQYNKMSMYYATLALRILAPDKAWPDEKLNSIYDKAAGFTPNDDGTYTITPKGMPIEGAYDGNYSPTTVLLMDDLGRYSHDPRFVERSTDMYKSLSNYFYLSNDGNGFIGLRQEEVTSWRPNHTPGRIQYKFSPYAAVTLKIPEAIRFFDLFIQHGRGNEIDLRKPWAHFYGTTSWVMDINDNYPAFSRLLPTASRLPLEPDGKDYVWTDEAAGTVVVRHGDTRMYMTMNWRSSGDKPNNKARIHYTTSVVDRIALTMMDSPFGNKQLYTARYGDYVVVMNESKTAYQVKVPAEWKAAADLVTGAKIEANNALQVKPQSTVVLYLGK